MTSRSLLLFASSAVLLAALTGCSLSSGGAGGGAASTSPSPATSTPPPSSKDHQVQLTAIPAECPSPDAVSISVHVSLPQLYSDPTDGRLQCTYYNGSPDTGLFLMFSASQGISADDFGKQILQATPSAESVPDVGDAAYFTTVTTSGSTVGALNFLSGAVAGYVYGPIAFSTKENLAALVGDQILVP